jgi:hypothetical protein
VIELHALFDKLWRCKIKIWWDNLWIREDEFHPSLDIDVIAMSYMTKRQQENYLSKICQRRQIAHERDLEKE